MVAVLGKGLLPRFMPLPVGKNTSSVTFGTNYCFTKIGHKFMVLKFARALWKNFYSSSFQPVMAKRETTECSFSLFPLESLTSPLSCSFVFQVLQSQSNEGLYFEAIENYHPKGKPKPRFD